MNTLAPNKSAQAGALDQLSSGVQGVRVSLQYTFDLPKTSRDARNDFLRSEFQRVVDSLIHKGTELELDSISISGQTIEAILPAGDLELITQELNDHGIRVDLLIARQVL